MRPPRLATWLIAREIVDRRGEDLLGDLEELFHAHALEHGRGAARRWYWRQATHIIVDAIGERRRQPQPPAGDSPMQTILQDLRYSLRSLRANPGFTAVAVLMLALGIGANSTIFSWVNAVLLDPMPGSARTKELVQFTYLYKGDVLPSFSYPDYHDIAGAAKQVTGIIGTEDLSVGVQIDREAERAWSELVTANFFDVLGARIALGRGFTPEEERPGAPSTVVLSDLYWQRRFDSDPNVIGRQIKINSQPFTIVGVAAPGFFGAVSGLSYDMWLPIGAQPAVMPGGDRLTVRGSRWLALIGRLAPGSTREQARAELDATIEQMRTTWASQNRYIDHQAAVFPLDNSPDGGIAVLRPVLLILMAVAGIVLLITCANLAGLLLARASSRQREMAIRLSMGAGRWRIVQQLMVEGIVLAGLGSAGALIALRWTSGLLIGFAPPSELPIHLAVAVDARVVWFTALVAVGTVLLFALAPAAQAAPADVATTLRDSGSAGRAFMRHRLRRGLVAAQVALSISLLVGAGLCIRSLNEAARMTPGFQAEGVVVGWLDLFSAGYTPENGRDYYPRALDRVGTMPGVESVTLSRRIPLGFSGGSFSDVTVEGHTPADGDPQGVSFNSVGPDYAGTMRIPVIAGRDLSRDDTFGRPRVTLVNETMARTYWKDRDPVGGRVMFGVPRPGQEPQWWTVVGVTKDIKQRSLTERPTPAMMIPMLQSYSSTAVLMVRTASDQTAIGAALQRAFREIDPQVPFYNVSALADHTKAATFQQKMAGNLLVVFGVLALALAGIGSYGVLSYLVGARRREIGIRLAIGATRQDVFRLIAGNGIRLIGIGLVIGLLLSVGVGMGLQSLLIGINPIDPITYAGVIAVLMVVAAAACLLPARRAASLDPIETLREQ
ncbi:MAG TPA: ADOP family duplicated permease [Vicinamibacterales bacterium]|nr:ADOP family duplicated permease [Vicinamibacterales bacterium]